MINIRNLDLYQEIRHTGNGINESKTESCVVFLIVLKDN